MSLLCTLSQFISGVQTTCTNVNTDTPLWALKQGCPSTVPFEGLGPPQKQHTFSSHLKLSAHNFRRSTDSGTHTTKFLELYSRWGAWSWDIICALWPVNPGENTAPKNSAGAGVGLGTRLTLHTDEHPLASFSLCTGKQPSQVFSVYI